MAPTNDRRLADLDGMLFDVPMVVSDEEGNLGHVSRLGIVGPEVDPVTDVRDAIAVAGRVEADGVDVVDRPHDLYALICGLAALDELNKAGDRRRNRFRAQIERALAEFN